MFRLWTNLFLVFLVAFPLSVVVNDVFVAGVEDATEDEVDADEGENEAKATNDEDSESKVETETDDDSADAADATDATEKVEPEEEQPTDDSATTGLRISPDVELSFLFPSYPDKQLPAGKPISVLVGFTNKGLKDFTIQTMDASFRYPQDYNYYVQNFTGYRYNRLVEGGTEASFEYAFHPHESYGGRPFGLVIVVTYKDEYGADFGGAVFNETVTFQEVEESFDGETFFLYLFLVALALLIIFGLNYAFSSVRGKKSSSKATPVEMGTQQRDDVDYGWLPKETTTDFNKSSPRRSPRNRRMKRSSGSGDE
eukprot:gene18673-20558_t